MKRNMDLARNILAIIETVIAVPCDVDIKGRSRAEISYHVKLLHEAGLIEATDLSSPEQLHWLPGHLTWAGHEFLDLARRDTLWERAKTKMLNETGGLSLELLRAVLLDLARRNLGL